MDATAQRMPLPLPDGHAKVLLHSCCAPCSGEVMEAMLASGIDYTIFFYNPNIHPRKEYELRKDENVRFAEQFGVPFIDADYDRDNWFERARGMENEPERGVRCTMCFDMRFERTALYAHEHGFPVITSSLGISRWKNMQQINDCGMRAAAKYPGLMYWSTTGARVVAPRA
ncbi:epoxyqueuosine reductase QueH [Xanthomonas cissicola]|uniref:epoxyqueuosine reductase QueH n=1 Tax=Xanthomonas cissicola TaxID=86186 RepID=UPI0022875DD3|nr:epoxyqueuosine reductase QueH [Xanthomonas cissicola]